MELRWLILLLSTGLLARGKRHSACDRKIMFTNDRKPLHAVRGLIPCLVLHPPLHACNNILVSEIVALCSSWSIRPWRIVDFCCFNCSWLAGRNWSRFAIVQFCYNVQRLHSRIPAVRMVCRCGKLNYCREFYESFIRKIFLKRVFLQVLFRSRQ